MCTIGQMEKIFFGRFCDCIFSRLSFAGVIYRVLPAAIRAELLKLLNVRSHSPALRCCSTVCFSECWGLACGDTAAGTHEEPCNPLNHGWPNYGPGATGGPSRYLIRPTKLEVNVLFSLQKRAVSGRNLPGPRTTEALLPLIPPSNKFNDYK